MKGLGSNAGPLTDKWCAYIQCCDTRTSGIRFRLSDELLRDTADEVLHVKFPLNQPSMSVGCLMPNELVPKYLEGFKT